MTNETPESAAELSASLSLAFLLVLERLAPKERAAYLLREIFDEPYSDVAATLGIQEATCRQLVSRARKRIGRIAPGTAVPTERQEELLAAFQVAISTGSTTQLAALMAEDIEIRADGGGKVLALLHPLPGKAGVLNFLTETLHPSWRGFRWQPVHINGTKGALVSDNSVVIASVSFACNTEGKLSGIYTVRNPDELAHVGDVQGTIQ